MKHPFVVATANESATTPHHALSRRRLPWILAVLLGIVLFLSMVVGLYQTPSPDENNIRTCTLRPPKCFHRIFLETTVTDPFRDSDRVRVCLDDLCTDSTATDRFSRHAALRFHLANPWETSDADSSETTRWRILIWDVTNDQMRRAKTVQLMALDKDTSNVVWNTTSPTHFEPVYPNGKSCGPGCYEMHWEIGVDEES